MSESSRILGVMVVVGRPPPHGVDLIRTAYRIFPSICPVMAGLLTKWAIVQPRLDKINIPNLCSQGCTNCLDFGHCESIIWKKKDKDSSLRHYVWCPLFDQRGRLARLAARRERLDVMETPPIFALISPNAEGRRRFRNLR